MRTIFMIITCMLLSSTAYADSKKGFVGANTAIETGGFVGPDAGGEITVKEIIASAHDDMRVIIKGNVIKRISNDKYLFSDGTGQIIVDIDRKIMPPQSFTPSNTIKIYGKVDRDYFPEKIKIDAKAVELVK